LCCFLFLKTAFVGSFYFRTDQHEFSHKYPLAVGAFWFGPTRLYHLGKTGPKSKQIPASSCGSGERGCLAGMFWIGDTYAYSLSPSQEFRPDRNVSRNHWIAWKRRWPQSRGCADRIELCCICQLAALLRYRRYPPCASHLSIPVFCGFANVRRLRLFGR